MIKKKTKFCLKLLLFMLPISVVLVVGGIVLAVTNISTPTSLNYSISSMPTVMQNFKEVNCATMSTYTTFVLTDNRDNTKYQVRKMPDGKCWMIDNLKLAGGTTLTTANTNLNGTQGSDFAAKWATLSAPVHDTATHNNGVCTADSSVAKANGSGYLTCDGTVYTDANDGFVAYSDPSIGGNYYENCVAGTYYGTSESSLTGCGYLYNWYTATAGSGNYQKGTDTYATASICPAGWRLPYNIESNDFAVLNNAMSTGEIGPSTYNNDKTNTHWLYNGPFMGSLSGIYSSGTSLYMNQGNSGYYWGSRATSVGGAYGLQININGVNPNNGTNGKANGQALRCLI
ncbi:hypothetical protein LJC64_03570 [Ruminococcaceae bacterium OttesenSCG-928-A11]|nr:hypothetical protein [Ruminococcaceae bacterium OttesenSCG-928-A11]